MRRRGLATDVDTAAAEGPPLSRRGFLAAAGGAGLGVVAGCLGVSGESAGEVFVLSAGSLASLFDSAIGPGFESEHGADYRGEFHGSNAVMRMVLEGKKAPDVIVSADVELLRERLSDDKAPWDVVFAGNALVIAYGPNTAVGERLERGDPWQDVLEAADAEIARSDPDLDPLGYRAVQLFDLAEEYYDQPGLSESLRDNLVIDPKEPHLLAGIETGNRAAAIVYENMAVDHGLPYVELPEELDFSSPDLADHYAQATYTIEEGPTVEGTPIRYNLTIPSSAPHPGLARELVGFLLSNPGLLEENGLVLGDAYPQIQGPVPEEVLP